MSDAVYVYLTEYEVMFADINWDRILTFDEFVKSHNQYLSEWVSVKVDGTVPISAFSDLKTQH